MSAVVDFMMWPGIWLTLGIVIGAFGAWSVMARNLDSKAHTMASLAYESAKWESGQTQPQHVVRPVHTRQMDDDLA